MERPKKLARLKWIVDILFLTFVFQNLSVIELTIILFLQLILFS